MKKEKKENLRKIKALVFDRFYGDEPNAAFAVLGRVLIAAAISFFAIGYVFSQYAMPVNATLLPLVATAAAAGFSLLFAFVRKRFAIPVLVAFTGFAVLWRLDEILSRLSYFADAFLLEFNGRLFDTTNYLFHPIKEIQTNGIYTAEFTDGMNFGCVVVCVLFAFITAAGLIGKPNIFPSLSFLAILWVPRLGAERLLYDWRLIPLTAFYAGAIAISAYYRDGMAIRRVYLSGDYRKRLLMEEKRFNVMLRTQGIGERAASRGIRYSKYFSSVMSAAAIFAALGIVVSIVLADSTGIDYQPFYDAVKDFRGFGNPQSTPFKSGAESEYFVSPSNSVLRNNDRLRLTPPSVDMNDLIRVTLSSSTGSKKVYLRGDVGINFDGVSWSSPVKDEPNEWRSMGFASEWLPIEMTALSDDKFAYQYGEHAQFADICVEYLCNTDIVFAPPYDDMYSGFSSNSSFDVYGDFSMRRRTVESIGEKTYFTAIVADYSDAYDVSDIRAFAEACEAYGYYRINTFNGIIKSINKKLGRSDGTINVYDYEGYVNSHYLTIPADLKRELSQYVSQTGLSQKIDGYVNQYIGMFSRYSEYTQEMAERFLTATALSHYLKENFSYSLTAAVDGKNPIMSFLNDTKSGHCALFASSMTLMLREMGIPARYCTGFVANSNLTMQTLRSKDLHAWCEVYLNELGWVTFDPTAGTNGSGITQNSSADSSETSSRYGVENSSSSDSDTQSGQISRPHNSSESVSDSSQSSDSRQSGNTHDSSSPSDENSLKITDILPYLLIMLAVIAALGFIALAVAVYLRIKKRAYKNIQAVFRDENSERVYKTMLSILDFCGLRPNGGEQPYDFFERVEKAILVNIIECYDLFERLAFGDTELDVSERAILSGAFEKVYKAAEDIYMPIGKLRLRIYFIKLYKI